MIMSIVSSLRACHACKQASRGDVDSLGVRVCRNMILVVDFFSKISSTSAGRISSDSVQPI